MLVKKYKNVKESDCFALKSNNFLNDLAMYDIDELVRFYLSSIIRIGILLFIFATNEPRCLTIASLF